MHSTKLIILKVDDNEVLQYMYSVQCDMRKRPNANSIVEASVIECVLNSFISVFDSCCEE